jgi:hypothetical protein
MTHGDGPRWLTDPEVAVFVTGEEALAVGAVEEHGLGEAVGRLFGRSAEDVKADWTKTVGQMRFFLEGLPLSALGYEMTEVTFQLAFSATGRLAFIAEAGLTSSVSVTFHPAPPRDGSE